MILFYDLENEQLKYEKEAIEELLSKNQDGNVVISATCGIDTINLKEKIDRLKQKTNNRAKINVELEYNKQYVYDEKEVMQLQKVDDICKEKDVNMRLRLSGSSGSFQNFLIAREKIENFADKLNSITIPENGRLVPLSPIEKFFVIYKFVGNRIYEQADNFLDDSMRNWIGVLSGDKVICSGFASLLKCVCDRVFQNGEIQCLMQGTDVYDKAGENLKGGHANNLVIVKDPKYNRFGLYASDSCWGRTKESNNMEGEFTYCLNPIDIFAKFKDSSFKFADELFFYQIVDGVMLEKNHTNCYGKELIYSVYDAVGVSPLLYKEPRKLVSEAKLEYIKKRQEELNKRNKIVMDKIKTITTKERFNLMCIQIPAFYPNSFKEKYPVLSKYEDFFNELTVDNFEENLETVKEFESFYNENKGIFTRLEQKAKENDLNIFSSIRRHIIRNSEKLNDSYIEQINAIEEEVNNDIAKAKEQFLADGKDFILAPNIPLDAVKNGIRAVAIFAGITEEEQIEQYVNKEISKLEQIRIQKFDLENEESISK